MAYHQLSDGRRVYFEHYAGTKTPFVLSHGWGMSSTIWVDVIERLLKAGHEVLAIDHRGCGKSDRDFDDVSISALAGDIVDIVTARNLRPAILNGWSLGGAVVVEAVDRLGAAAAGLVLTCAASPRYVQADDFPYGGHRADVLGMPDAIL
ncbi:MAG: alpha/beta hydrolase, partial [Alphaproteobacteria bacterium PA3]